MEATGLARPIKSHGDHVGKRDLATSCCLRHGRIDGTVPMAANIHAPELHLADSSRVPARFQQPAHVMLKMSPQMHGNSSWFLPNRHPVPCALRSRAARKWPDQFQPFFPTEDFSQTACWQITLQATGIGLREWSGDVYVFATSGGSSAVSLQAEAGLQLASLSWLMEMLPCRLSVPSADALKPNKPFSSSSVGPEPASNQSEVK
jgi:hypothetical protein